MKYLLAPFLSLILLLTLSTPALARFHVGASIIDTRLHSRDYKTVKHSEPSISYNIGYYKEFADNWFGDLTTNAVLSAIKGRDERAILYKGAKSLNTKNRVTYGSGCFGKRFNRLTVCTSFTLVHVDKKIYSGNIYLNTEKSYGIVYGGNLNYFVTKKVSTSLFCVLPSPHIDLRFSCGGGVNLYF